LQWDDFWLVRSPGRFFGFLQISWPKIVLGREKRNGPANRVVREKAIRGRMASHLKLS
jgi:hypothetical protein